MGKLSIKKLNELLVLIFDECRKPSVRRKLGKGERPLGVRKEVSGHQLLLDCLGVGYGVKSGKAMAVYDRARKELAPTHGLDESYVIAQAKRLNREKADKILKDP